MKPGRRRIKTGIAHVIPNNFKKKEVKATASSTDHEELREEESPPEIEPILIDVSSDNATYYDSVRHDLIGR